MNEKFLITKDGNSYEVTKLFDFSSNGINYIVYQEGEDILASRCTIEDNDLHLSNIEGEEEWEMVSSMINKKYGGYNE